MTAPSPTSTDNPVSSQPASGDTLPEPDAALPAVPPDDSPPAADGTSAVRSRGNRHGIGGDSHPATGTGASRRAAAAGSVDRGTPCAHAPRTARSRGIAAAARERGKEPASSRGDLLRTYHTLGFTLFAEGITEFITSDGCGFVRFPRYSFRPGPQDPFISFQLAKRLSLKGGHLVTARFRPPAHREKYMTVEEVLTIEGIPVAEWKEPKDFDTLTARFPDARVTLDSGAGSSLTARAVDIIAPHRPRPARTARGASARWQNDPDEGTRAGGHPLQSRPPRHPPARG